MEDHWQKLSRRPSKVWIYLRKIWQRNILLLSCFFWWQWCSFFLKLYSVWRKLYKHLLSHCEYVMYRQVRYVGVWCWHRWNYCWSCKEDQGTLSSMQGKCVFCDVPVTSDLFSVHHWCCSYVTELAYIVSETSGAKMSMKMKHWTYGASRKLTYMLLLFFPELNIITSVWILSSLIVKWMQKKYFLLQNIFWNWVNAFINYVISG